jgi:hypothetical protein
MSREWPLCTGLTVHRFSKLTESKIKDEKKGVYLELTEKQRTFIHSPSQPCSTYSLKEFIECSNVTLRKRLRENVSCFIYNLKELLFDRDDQSVPECKTQRSASKVSFTWGETLRNITIIVYFNYIYKMFNFKISENKFAIIAKTNYRTGNKLT